jgi:hypothetical protein
VSLRRDQLIPVNKGGEQERTIGKRAGGGGEKNSGCAKTFCNKSESEFNVVVVKSVSNAN